MKFFKDGDEYYLKIGDNTIWLEKQEGVYNLDASWDSTNPRILLFSSDDLKVIARVLDCLNKALENDGKEEARLQSGVTKKEFFVFHKWGDGFKSFRSTNERDAYADKCINQWVQDWGNEFDLFPADFCVGEITHRLFGDQDTGYKLTKFR